ncbi:MAG: iron ABC transporter permease [Proteobacteria bacterium]|nr:iron ABC transporter permease [Pseudomonadota bacterium]
MAYRQLALGCRCEFEFQIGLALVFAGISIGLGLALGSVHVGMAHLWQAMWHEGSTQNILIFWSIRFPRVASAFVCGSLLALSGALLQVLLRNPLADPYLLGVSGGASTAVLLLIFLDAPAWLLRPGALIGSLISIGLVLIVSLRTGGWRSDRLLLVGVALSAGFGAVITLILSLASNNNLKGMLFWLMGDLSQAGVPELALVVLVITSLAAIWLSPILNLLLLGDEKAATLGIALWPTKLAIFLIASFATAAAVIQAGTIGFVGLIIPHALRLVRVTDYRRLLPLSILVGGGFLCDADTLGRVLFSPVELPVGVVTALIGVPLFLLLLARKPA